MRLIIIALFLLPLAAAAQADYEYSYYPSGEYVKMVRVRAKDTVSHTEKTKWATDSLPGKALVRIQHTEDHRLTISNVGTSANAATQLYQQQVVYKGTEKGAILYESTGPNKETVLVNPLYGWAIIRFKVCTGPLLKPGECNVESHYFGDVPLDLYVY